MLSISAEIERILKMNGIDDKPHKPRRMMMAVAAPLLLHGLGTGEFEIAQRRKEPTPEDVVVAQRAEADRKERAEAKRQRKRARNVKRAT